jgi:hypothetical protein
MLRNSLVSGEWGVGTGGGCLPCAASFFLPAEENAIEKRRKGE